MIGISDVGRSSLFLIVVLCVFPAVCEAWVEEVLHEVFFIRRSASSESALLAKGEMKVFIYTKNSQPTHIVRLKKTILSSLNINDKQFKTQFSISIFENGDLLLEFSSNTDAEIENPARLDAILRRGFVSIKWDLMNSRDLKVSVRLTKKSLQTTVQVNGETSYSSIAIEPERLEELRQTMIGDQLIHALITEPHPPVIQGFNLLLGLGQELQLELRGDSQRRVTGSCVVGCDASDVVYKVVTGTGFSTGYRFCKQHERIMLGFLPVVMTVHKNKHLNRDGCDQAISNKPEDILMLLSANQPLNRELEEGRAFPFLSELQSRHEVIEFLERAGISMRVAGPEASMPLEETESTHETENKPEGSQAGITDSSTGASVMSDLIPDLPPGVYVATTLENLPDLQRAINGPASVRMPFEPAGSAGGGWPPWGWGSGGAAGGASHNPQWSAWPFGGIWSVSEDDDLSRKKKK